MNAVLLSLLALVSNTETVPPDLGPAIERAVSLLVEMHEILHLEWTDRVQLKHSGDGEAERPFR